MSNKNIQKFIFIDYKILLLFSDGSVEAFGGFSYLVENGQKFEFYFGTNGYINIHDNQRSDLRRNEYRKINIIDIVSKNTKLLFLLEDNTICSYSLNINSNRIHYQTNTFSTRVRKMVFIDNTPFALLENGDFVNIENNSKINFLNLKGRNIRNIEYYTNNILILLDDNSVQIYSLGNYNFNEKRNIDLRTSYSSTLNGPAIKQIACGRNCDYALLLLQNGTVIGWGQNQYRQCEDQDYRNLSRKIIQIACGNIHNIALLDDGTIKCWGNSNNGKLSTQDFSHLHIKQLSAYDNCSAVLTDNQVQLWGNTTLVHSDDINYFNFIDRRSRENVRSPSRDFKPQPDFFINDEEQEQTRVQVPVCVQVQEPQRDIVALNSQCSICLENKDFTINYDDDNLIKILPCGHSLHKQCYESLSIHQCPECRTDFNPRNQGLLNIQTNNCNANCGRTLDFTNNFNRNNLYIASDGFIYHESCLPYNRTNHNIYFKKYLKYKNKYISLTK